MKTTSKMKATKKMNKTLKMMMTSKLMVNIDSHTTTEVKPEMIPGV